MRSKRFCVMGVMAALHCTVFAAPAPGGKPGDNPGQRAQLVAVRYVVLTSELSASISRLNVREGERFRQGDLLISYDCSLNRARLARAEQAELAAQKKVEVAQELDELKSISRADVEQARSALAVAGAETNLERVMMRRCSVSAPFAGRVGETYVRPSEHVAEGKELLSIYDDSAFEVQTIVPSRWLAWLKPGMPMRLIVDETGQTHVARVVRIAGSIDPVSQSVRVIGRLENRGGQNGAVLLHGMSGSVHIDKPGAAKP